MTDDPILQSLRQTFGISSIKTHDISLANFSFKIRVLTPQDVALVSRLADMKSATRSEFNANFKTATLALAICSINGKPTHELFNVPLNKDIPIQDPLLPPFAVRQVAAIKLFDFMSETLAAQTVQSLISMYDEIINEVSMETPEGSSLYACQNNHAAVLLTRESPYFCRECGAKMSLVKKPEGGQPPLT